MMKRREITENDEERVIFENDESVAKCIRSDR